MDNLPKNVSDVSSPPPTDMVGKKIILFGRISCPDCARIKKFLAENAIEYEYHDIDQDRVGLKWLSSFSTFIPVVIMLDGTIMYSPSNPELMAKIQGDSVNKKVAMTEPELFDVVIIGAGPAGSSAAIYAVRKSLKVLVVTKTIGGQAAQSGDVENYLGFSMISGADLALRFRDDLKRFENDGIWFKEGVDVSAIEGFEGNFVVKTAQGGSYRGKTVLIATGRVPRMLGIPGEKELFGKGVATCATCDAPLYRGRRVVVVGGGNSALDAAISLMKIAKEVTIINNQAQLRGDSIMLANVEAAKNVTILNNHEVISIKGAKTVEGIVIKPLTGGDEQTIGVDGVFIEIGWTPSVDFAPAQLQMNDRHEIMVDEFNKTSFDGIWAAGDVNNLWGEQIIIAAGEGAKAALSIAEHIAKTPHNATSNAHMG